MPPPDSAQTQLRLSRAEPGLIGFGLGETRSDFERLEPKVRVVLRAVRQREDQHAAAHPIPRVK